MKHHDLLLITSPPASGKTYWIETFAEKVSPARILVISPLRALADECMDKWKERIDIMTPEEWLGKKLHSEIVIFDEFHLFFYWGDTFRFRMWEAFYEISTRASLTVLLTATLFPEMKEEIKLFSPQFDSLLWIDHGNQILKFKPARYIKAPSRNWILKQIENEDYGASVKLIFCQYREEVYEIEKRLRNSGFSCLTCIGGESKYFKDKLKHTPLPDFIISTTVLSHGVNLPQIRKIFFLYEVNNLDFWIQMVARGGRRGESYEVQALEKPIDVKWNFWQNFIDVLWLTLLQKISLKGLRNF